MKSEIEMEQVWMSCAHYPVCIVTVEPGDMPERNNPSALDTMLDRILCLVKKEAANALGIPTKDVDFMRIMSSSQPWEWMVSYRSQHWQEQAEQSLREMGLSTEDILSGKDLLFTDHTGIFMPKE